MLRDVRERAVRAAVDIAATHGIRASAPVVLADGFNVVVWLSPAPVVARVMTLSAALRPRGDGHIARELAIAEFLAMRGIPASRPSSEVPPGPHRCRGLWLSFWEHLEVDVDATQSPEVVGSRLHELHRALRDYPGPGAVLDVPLSDIAEFLRTGGKRQVVAPGDLGRIERRLAALHPLIGSSRSPHRWLHGDAHPGNLLRANGEWMWVDFEECVFGPVEWDLACLRGSQRVDGAAALRAYETENSVLSEGMAISGEQAISEEQASLESFRQLRDLQAAGWLAVLAERFPEHSGRARDFLDAQG